jgi:thiol:disulfide interchange protein DsbD
MLAAAATLALAVWLVTGLAGRRLGELEAFLPPIDPATAIARGDQHWLTSYDEALAVAAKTNRPVLVNFTGYTCTNCRWMEANMFTRPEIASELSRFVLVELYTDGRDELNQRYQQLEQDLFGTVALPYYAILEPGGTPKVAFGGLTRSSDEYLNFLRY